MRIKFTLKYGGTQYLSVKDFTVRQYTEPANGKSFWYFSTGDWFSYSDGIYRFNSQADVEKILYDIYMEEALGNVVIYRFDAKLEELEIECI